MDPLIHYEVDDVVYMLYIYRNNSENADNLICDDRDIKIFNKTITENLQIRLMQIVWKYVSFSPV